MITPAFYRSSRMVLNVPWYSLPASSLFANMLVLTVFQLKVIPPHPLSDTTPSSMLLANESPFVLISQSSADTVTSWITLDNDGNAPLESGPIHPTCFRANLMISLHEPITLYQEHFRQNPIFFHPSTRILLI
jgi:hypothetical protein